MTTHLLKNCHKSIYLEFAIPTDNVHSFICDLGLVLTEL